MRETLSINKLYKNLIFIGIVVGPIYWLMFTTDGTRRTDTMVLWLFGGNSMEINFGALDYQFREEDWKTVYPDAEWNCQDRDNDFGDRYCVAEVASYNGIPSSYLSVFFLGPRTTAVKLVYRDQYHKDIGDDLLYQLGQPAQVKAGNDDIYQWNTAGGQILIKKDLTRGEDPVLMWLAKRG